MDLNQEEMRRFLWCVQGTLHRREDIDQAPPGLRAYFAQQVEGMAVDATVDVAALTEMYEGGEIIKGPNDAPQRAALAAEPAHYGALMARIQALSDDEVVRLRQQVQPLLRFPPSHDRCN